LTEQKTLYTPDISKEELTPRMNVDKGLKAFCLHIAHGGNCAFALFLSYGERDRLFCGKFGTKEFESRF
jgi:hypothetical protein